MKPFMQPLSAKEETRYLSYLYKGNGEEKKEALDQLVQHNMRLVAHIAKKYQNSEEDLEEFISVGCVGLMKGILSYDDTKGSKLGTYAARCIENELLMMLRSRKKLSREVSIQEPAVIDSDGNELSLMDLLVGESKDVVESIHTNEMISKIMRLLHQELSSREREIILLRYGFVNGKEYTQKEVGDRLSISRSYVSRIEKKALRKLRERLRTEE